MQAHYDSKANAISIKLGEAVRADTADEVHARAIVAIEDARPVEVQLLYPDLGVAEPLRAVVSKYDLDAEALIAAAQAALSAPDRSVTLAVAVRSAA